jgi:hypothetical protein
MPIRPDEAVPADPIAAACRRMDEPAGQATLGDISIRELIGDARR